MTPWWKRAEVWGSLALAALCFVAGPFPPDRDHVVGAVIALHLAVVFAQRPDARPAAVTPARRGPAMRYAALRAAIVFAVVMAFVLPMALAEGAPQLAAGLALALTVAVTSAAAGWVERSTQLGRSRLTHAGAFVAISSVMAAGLAVATLQAGYAVGLLTTGDPARAGALAFESADHVSSLAASTILPMAVAQGVASLAVLQRRAAAFLAFVACSVGAALIGNSTDDDRLVAIGSSAFLGASVFGFATLAAGAVETWWWPPSDEESRDGLEGPPR